MATFLLVHGGMHGGWCWEKLLPFLGRFGHSAVAIDLPGAGGEIPAPDVSLERWRDVVARAIDYASEPPVLVGHSMGGLAITIGAAAYPDRLKSLVYLCAVVPDPGAASADGPASRRMRELFVSRDGGETLEFEPEVARDIFYHECSRELADMAVSRLRPQAARPLREPPLFDPRSIAAVDTHYIRTTKDRCIPPDLQQVYRDRLSDAIEHVLPTGHSPFYSHPAMLAQLLDRIAQPGQSEHASR